MTKSKNQEIKFSLKTKDEELINIFYSKDKNECTLTRNGKNDPRYGTIQMCDRLSLRVFIDKSSAEIFINDGELVFTERYYTENQPSMHLSVSEEAFVSSTIYHLKKDAISYE